MLSREAHSSVLKSGPIATFCTQSVPVDVPTDDVKFEDVLDDLIDMGMRNLPI